MIDFRASAEFATPEQGPFQGYVPDLVPRRQVGLASGLMGPMIILGILEAVTTVATLANVDESSKTSPPPRGP